MFTHLFAYPLYDIPNTCGPGWDTCATFDFERPVSIPITRENVAERSRTLLGQYKQKAELFRHNHLLIPLGIFLVFMQLSILGDDFKYKTLEMTNKIFENYQKLFDHINSDASFGVHIRFSNLKDYFSAVQASQAKDTSLAFPTYHGDYFPYIDQAQDFWTGYYTTRPFTKGLSRRLSSAIRDANALCAVHMAQVHRVAVGFDSF